MASETYAFNVGGGGPLRSLAHPCCLAALP